MPVSLITEQHASGYPVQATTSPRSYHRPANLATPRSTMHLAMLAIVLSVVIEHVFAICSGFIYGIGVVQHMGNFTLCTSRHFSPRSPATSDAYLQTTSTIRAARSSSASPQTRTYAHSLYSGALRSLLLSTHIKTGPPERGECQHRRLACRTL